MTTRKIAIIGGGMAGMSAAHELIKLSQASGVAFDIRIYERSDALGGKSKSQLYPLSDGGPMAPAMWPGEHGFRFFPAFYNHIIDTMRTTPYTRPDGVVTTIESELQEGAGGGVGADGKLTIVARPVKTGEQVYTAIKGMLGNLGLTVKDMTGYGLVLLQFLTSSLERRLDEYDGTGWDDFIGAKTNYYGERARKLLLAIPGNLSAMKAHEGSARTIGNTSLQVLYNFNSANNQREDAVLPAPTDLAWLQPWAKYLADEGVKVTFGCQWEGFDIDHERALISGARFAAPIAGEGPNEGASATVTADYYVLAVPLEVTKAALVEDSSLAEFDPTFANLNHASLDEALRDMVGAQFFLSRDISICKGHLLYPFTPLALTSISQGQFWVHKPPSSFGVPGLAGVLSVIISDWDTPIPDGPNKGKTARQLGSDKAILDEVWREIVAAIDKSKDADGKVIDLSEPGLVLGAHLCTQMVVTPSGATNNVPLLVHPRNAFKHRPLAQTRAPNLLLASDYVRTYTDLATMESANEAARRAVRTIAYREDIHEDLWPKLYPLNEHRLFALGRSIDGVLYRLGLPHVMAPALRVIFGKESADGEALEADGRRSMSPEDYARALAAIDEGIDAWRSASVADGTEPQQEGFFSDLLGTLLGGAAPGVTDDDVIAIVKRVRAWVGSHPHLFDGAAFDFRSEAALRGFIDGWEQLLRGSTPASGG